MVEVIYTYTYRSGGLVSGTLGGYLQEVRGVMEAKVDIPLLVLGGGIGGAAAALS